MIINGEQKMEFDYYKTKPAILASDIAKYMITKSIDYGFGVSVLQLGTLLYLVQGEAIAQLGEAAFLDDIEAWSYGPVVRSVRERYRIFGANIIMRRFDLYYAYSWPSELRIIIDEVLLKYGRLSAWNLVQLTHKPDTPWHRAHEENLSFIPIHYMKELWGNQL